MGKQSDGTGLIAHDSWLEAYRGKLEWRNDKYWQQVKEIEKAVGSVEKMAQGYAYFGLNRGEKEGKLGVWYREWAPMALSLALTGDFNGWDRTKNPMKKDEFGVWEIFLPDKDYGGKLVHGSRVKVHVVSRKGGQDRIPAYIRRVELDPDSRSFVGVYWQPKRAFDWKSKRPQRPRSLRVYEAHVGMAQEEGKIGSFTEFRENVLPRIVDLSYNAIQLMAIAHHPYYASFGYQVGSFFAVSSYMGTPEELKELIDAAHSQGLLVLMDLVHSHAIKNTDDGLNEFDGSGYQYFHKGVRGEHSAWDTKLFDYGKFEVLRFLLSNVRFYMDEFLFDGFRYDGVTSMLYTHHGLGPAFDNYDRYFAQGEVDEEALVYLKLANELIHRLNPESITVAEDVSGFPGIARPVDEGGIGFDYRLAMGIPDYWIKLVKHVKDEDWNMEELFGVLRNRREGEAHIAYAESHDQALVGDKTLVFRLMDEHMYQNMAIGHEDLVIERGMALHKMIRLVTFALGGEGWLSFMGNEFGHPEWIDFPREGNGDSYHYARRQWSLSDNKLLRYQFLNNFDRGMQRLDAELEILAHGLIEQLLVHEEKKLLVFRRGPFVVACNFHTSNSYEGLRLGVPDKGDYRVVLSSDEKEYGGFSRVKKDQVYPIQDEGWNGRGQSIQVYMPARTGQVLFLSE